MKHGEPQHLLLRPKKCSANNIHDVSHAYGVFRFASFAMWLAYGGLESLEFGSVSGSTCILPNA
jgi:hypothetical protein